MDLEKVLTSIVRHAVQLSNTDTGTIYEFDEGNQTFVPMINYGMSTEIIKLLKENFLKQ